MKILILLVLFVCLPAAAQGQGVTATQASKRIAGGLVFDKEVFDYKASPSDAEFTATFNLRNNGPKVVNITKLDSSCTCLSVKASRYELKPGGESVVTAVFNIPKHSGESEKLIVVATDDPELPLKRLKVKVSVPSIIEISPAIAEWKIGGPIESREIAFKVLQDRPIRILEATSSRRQVSITVKTIEVGREYRLVLTPLSTDEGLLGFVSIRTDCEIKSLQQQITYFKIK